MKSKKELNTIKEEVEAVSRKLHELTEEELAQVTGGKENMPIPNTDDPTVSVSIATFSDSK